VIKALEKWLWMKIYKKPPKPYACYLGIVYTWFCIGLIVTLAIFLLVALAGGDTVVSGKWMGVSCGVVLLLIAVALGYITYSSDRKYGYYDAIHKSATEYWHKKRKEYGLE